MQYGLQTIFCLPIWLWPESDSIFVITAAFSSLRSILVVELIGLDRLTTCFNQLVILHGIAIISGTPLACKHKLLLVSIYYYSKRTLK